MTEAATLTPTARLVLAVLHPSAEPLTYTDLAARTGASLWTLQDLLPTLVSTGYLPARNITVRASSRSRR
jgi:DNA-binding IclR family transcriptional regulator